MQLGYLKQIQTTKSQSMCCKSS